MPPPLVDIGVNLGHASFRADRAAVIARAQEAGVGVLVVTGANLRSSQEAAALAEQYPGILYATAGVHPHNARECDDRTLHALRALAARPVVRAIGECGLDYNRDFSPRPVQDRWFAAQLGLAAELGLPVFLHERDAHLNFLRILSEHRSALAGGVVHCFTGTATELDAYLALDLHIGITGWICDERRGTHLRDLVRRIPLDRLMLETDAPFLTPRNLPAAARTNRNEPALLPYVLQAVATARGESAAAVAAATTQTARAFFRLPAPA